MEDTINKYNFYVDCIKTISEQIEEMNKEIENNVKSLILLYGDISNVPDDHELAIKIKNTVNEIANKTKLFKNYNDKRMNILASINNI